jgi:phosphoglycerate kinase
MEIKSIREAQDLRGQTVFLRVDFNVPMKKGKVLEDFKIHQCLDDIRWLQARDCKIIIASHLGKPKNSKDKDCSLKPIAKILAKLLECPVAFVGDCVGPEVKAKAIKLKPRQILLLENLRFHKDEQKDSPAFAKRLAQLADIYINDAFAVSHRADASVSAIKDFLPSYAGLLLEKEVRSLHRVLKPKKPLVVVMAGSKIETKAPILKHLYPFASKILVGGALANAFFAAEGMEIGSSMIDEGGVKIAKAMLKDIARHGGASKLVLPKDLVIGTHLENKAIMPDNKIYVRKPRAVKFSDYICDIGPETIGLFAKYIKKANTIVWNGPLGLFEIPSFKQGTVIIARLIASRASGKAFAVVGGGETVEALHMSKMAEYVDWISTAGGAMLDYLSGMKMPGLKGIVSN